MRKTWAGFILAILINLIMFYPASAADSPVTVRLNNKVIDFGIAPVVENGTTVVPLRPLLEALGAKLDWNQTAGTVSANLQEVTLTLTAGSSNVIVNGKTVSLPIVPAIRDGKMFVPLRAIANLCNIRTDWDSTTSSVNLYPNKQATGYEAERDTVHQISMLSALLDGHYDGQTTFGELKKYGDTGIGTFDKLDGEVIELDGNFYQIKSDGVAYPVDEAMKTPFACVTYFEADKSAAINKEMNFQQFEDYVDSMISNKNLFYAIKVTGDFKYVKTRSVPAQQKPYPPLAEVTKSQPTFEFNNTKGTLVGFWCPSYVDGINVPGYHLHFINTDKSGGGHLLDFTIESGQIEIDVTPNFYMNLPTSEGFGEIDMSKDRSEETNNVEK